MHKSNKYTSLTQPYGRKQRLLAKSPLVLNHIPCYSTFKTAFGDRLEVKIVKSPCNHPLNYFQQLVLVNFSTKKIIKRPYFDVLARHLSRCLFLILPKYPLPAPTCRPFLGKRLHILQKAEILGPIYPWIFLIKRPIIWKRFKSIHHVGAYSIKTFKEYISLKIEQYRPFPVLIVFCLKKF